MSDHAPGEAKMHMQQMYLEQKRLSLSKASADYDPELRTAKIDSVKHVSSRFSIPKERRMPDPKILCDRIYSPQYSSVERHVPGLSLAKQLAPAPPPKPSICDTSYNPSMSYVKPRSPAVSLKNRTGRQPTSQKREDPSYTPSYTQVLPGPTHSPIIAKQAGRDRAVMPTPAYATFYDSKPVVPKHSVSSFSGISNPRSNDVGDLSRELDFLIQHTEKSWRHVDDTLSEFTEAVRK